MENNHTYNCFKVALAWFLAILGEVTLSGAVQTAALVFTVLQIYFLLRDKWWRERNAKDKP